MADRKITDLTALAAGSQATGDLLTIVDVSEAAAADKNKKITVESLFKGIPSNVGIGTSSPDHALDLIGTTSNALRIRSSTAASRGLEIWNDSGNDIAYISNYYNGSIVFQTGNTERMRVDSSGRLLLGTTTEGHPNLDDLTIATTGHTGITIRSGTSHDGQIGFSDGTSGDDEYRGQVLYNHNTNSMRFITDASERMRIDSSGRVGIGTSSLSHKLVVDQNNSGGIAAIHLPQDESTIQGSNANTQIKMGGNMTVSGGGAMLFNTAGSESARIDSSGRLLVGTTSSKESLSQIQCVRSSNSTLSIFSSDISASGQAKINIGPSNNITGAQIICDAEEDFSTGANRTARLSFVTRKDGTLTERMRITSSGTLLVGQTNESFGNNGHIFQSDGAAYHVRVSNPVLLLNRQSSDGEIVRISQDGNTEGTISVSGSDVSYNGATLSRYSQLAGGAERTEVLRGSVMSNLDEMCEWGEEDNEQLNRSKVSDVEGDRDVAGVFRCWDDDDDVYTNDFYLAMTGDFVIRIAQGTTVARGDLLMSAGDGTAKPQDDDIVRSKTIAKVTSTTVSTTYADGSYCVPCVLMAC